MGGVACLPSNRRTCLRLTRKQGQAERDPRRERSVPSSEGCPQGGVGTCVGYHKRFYSQGDREGREGCFGVEIEVD